MASEPKHHPAYSNPVLPEGINVGTEHPLKELALLGGGIGAAVLALVALFAWFGHVMAGFVSFETERSLAADIAIHWQDEDVDVRTQDYLRGIAAHLTQADPLPEGMEITVHLSEEDVVNAFATLGGHIVITRGLIDAMPNENALATVIAHEIGHVRERHVIRSLGRGVLTSLALGLLTGASQDDLTGNLIGSAGVTASLSFSRSQEHDADEIALHSVQALYGHVGGASSVFEALNRAGHPTPPEWLSTHPDLDKRTLALEEQAEREGWSAQGELSPLPEWLRH